MTEKELFYFKTVADEKSISQAARRLYIAQPSLSQYIKRIEENLGTLLFARTASGLTLTYAGERYYHMASQILKMYQDFETEISDINEMRTGRIHIGITNHLGTVLLPRVLSEFSTKCPLVEIQITEETSSVLEDLLLSGQLDLAIMHAPKEADNPSIAHEILSKDPFLLVTSAQNPLSLKAIEDRQQPYPQLDVRYLKEQRFIMLPGGQRIRQVTDSILKKAGILRPDIFLTVKNFATAQQLAAEGLGCTMIPAQYAALTSQNKSTAFYTIPQQYEAYWELCVATVKDSFLSKADRLFIDIIKERHVAGGTP